MSLTPDDVCGSDDFGREYTDEEIQALWPSACRELLGFARFLEAKSGITAAQLRLACRLAQQAYQSRFPPKDSHGTESHDIP